MDKTVESDGILNHTFKQRGEKAMEKKKVIMDVDTGSDDAIAIMMAVLSGQLDILGLSLIHLSNNVAEVELKSPAIR